MEYEIIIYIVAGLAGFIFVRYNYSKMSYYDYCDLQFTDM